MWECPCQVFKQYFLREILSDGFLATRNPKQRISGHGKPPHSGFLTTRSPKNWIPPRKIIIGIGFLTKNPKELISWREKSQAVDFLPKTEALDLLPRENLKQWIYRHKKSKAVYFLP